MGTRMRLAGSDEIFAAPESMDESAAVRWLARLFHSSADRRVKELSPGVYRCGNGRRGPNKRETVIRVVTD